MIEFFKSRVSRIGDGYVELRYQKAKRTVIILRNGKIDELMVSYDAGGAVRYFSGTGVGFSTFNKPEDVDKALERAGEASNLLKNPVKLKYAPPVKDTYIPPSSKEDVPLDEAVDLVKHYAEIAMGHEKVAQVQIQFMEKKLENLFLSNDGHEIEEHRPYMLLVFYVTASEGNVYQTIHRIWGGQRGFQALKGHEEEIERAVKTAVDLLNADPVDGGIYDVILEPTMGGLFIHEAFGHLSEADSAYKNPVLLEKMKVGKRFGKDFLNVIDDGSMEGEYGFYAYDDEGVKSARTYIIKNGIFNSRLHSRETAEYLGCELTGNARAINYRFPPIVRMSTTYIAPGDSTFQEMLEKIGNGLYVVGAAGGETSLEMFTFSAMYAYEIKNGKLGKMLRDVRLSGNVFDTLMNIEMIGNDLKIEAGHCGKMSQMPLPVSGGAPHLLVRKMVVGGK